MSVEKAVTIDTIQKEPLFTQNPQCTLSHDYLPKAVVILYISHHIYAHKLLIKLISLSIQLLWGGLSCGPQVSGGQTRVCTNIV